ncbi:hypothetical protein I3843_03G036800 [Carya illinoinensis]|nr:hypothetical protein I3843_03G036800 [Carya illinoinensis]
MNGDASGVGGENFDWNTDDELEVNDFSLSSCSSLTPPNGEAVVGCGEARSTAGCSNSKLIDHFIGMGFSKKMVSKAIQENGKYRFNSRNPSYILGELIPAQLSDSVFATFVLAAIESSPQGQPDVDSDNSSLDSGGSFLDDFSDIDSSSDTEEIMIPESDEDGKLLSLVKMGYTNSSLVELTDFICAAQMAKPKLKHSYSDFSKHKKRKLSDYAMWKKKRRNGVQDDDDEIHLPKSNDWIWCTCCWASLFIMRMWLLLLKGFGPPFHGSYMTSNRNLFDSKYFCAAARKRGYVHNLPIDNRFPLLPLPPRTIHEALPLTRKWWPSWDQRTKLNCIQTCIGSAKLTERIRKALEDYDGEPPLRVQKYVLDECCPLEPDEVEMLLGFPRNHTRGGGISRTDRYNHLVDTVAYHLSVLKDMFPGGINLLSLFSGIGGAEVALHRLGIRLKNVVSVEISEVNRNIVRELIDLADVQQLNGDRLEQMMNSFGGFDLVVGGSPCNNLAGSNRHHRDGLEGKESALFYDYFRILDLVKCIMTKAQ